MAETLDGRDFAMEARAAAYKPAGSPHSNRWGREGALVFSITFGGLMVGFGASPKPGWWSLPPTLPLGQMVAACFQPDEIRRREAIEDAFLLVSSGLLPGADAPRWLRTARDALAEQADLSIAEVAVAVGVDRSYLARAFQRSYGMPPSVYRRRILSARAVAAVARTETPLSRVAHESGFSDHAHMTRTLRSDTGLNPVLLRSLLTKEITSIQDHFRLPAETRDEESRNEGL
jgi:AraC-like DNA-binding protein